ncbi:hypothetical protein MRX96_026505 [Rhipicephalus microplus]
MGQTISYGNGLDEEPGWETKYIELLRKRKNTAARHLVQIGERIGPVRNLPENAANRGSRRNKASQGQREKKDSPQSLRLRLPHGSHPITALRILAVRVTVCCGAVDCRRRVNYV